MAELTQDRDGLLRLFANLPPSPPANPSSTGNPSTAGPQTLSPQQAQALNAAAAQIAAFRPLQFPAESAEPVRRLPAGRLPKLPGAASGRAEAGGSSFSAASGGPLLANPWGLNPASLQPLQLSRRISKAQGKKGVEKDPWETAYPEAGLAIVGRGKAVELALQNTFYLFYDDGTPS